MKGVINTSMLVFAALASGCAYDNSFLFAEQYIDDVWILTNPDGDRIVPADVATPDDVKAATVYAEVGAPQTSLYGGVTFDFLGTGGDICIWVDPEVAFWNQAVAPRPSVDGEKWTYPDNVFDDGDLDLFVGQSVYYTGSPGEEIGDFVVQYKDSLGNDVPISLAECPNAITAFNNGEFASGGRGAPEYCDLKSTDLGIGYTAVLRTWSTPLDDDRLGFGVVIVNGSCQHLKDVMTVGSNYNEECLVEGEAITPAGQDYGPFYGYSELSDAGRIWPRSEEFENAFCDPETNMKKFCNGEADDIAASGNQCEWHLPPNQNNRCYCGDPTDTPSGGSF
jgi:hypothetical protein